MILLPSLSLWALNMVSASAGPAAMAAIAIADNVYLSFPANVLELSVRAELLRALGYNATSKQG